MDKKNKIKSNSRGHMTYELSEAAVDGVWTIDRI